MPRATRVHSTPRARAPHQRQPLSKIPQIRGISDDAAKRELTPIGGLTSKADRQPCANLRKVADCIESKANLHEVAVRLEPSANWQKVAATSCRSDQSANLHSGPTVLDQAANLPREIVSLDQSANLRTDRPQEAAGIGEGRKDCRPSSELFATLLRLRREAAAEVERLLAFLDDTDADADLEPSGDEHEPELGSVEGGTRKRRLDQTAWADGLDGEPSLGAPEHHPDGLANDPWEIHSNAPTRTFCGAQFGWSSGNADDRELCTDIEEDDSHDGREPDLEDEPSLGSFDRMADQDHAWRQASSDVMRIMVGNMDEEVETWG